MVPEVDSEGLEDSAMDAQIQAMPESSDTNNTAEPKASKPRPKDIVWNEGSPVKAGQKGPDVIKDFVTRLPLAPGVYRMLNAEGDVLYVGKAKSLKARVSSYTRIGGHTQRIAAMILATARMEFVVTESETEALLLEASLIKSLKPRFNILLRDDKSFPYILIRRDHEAPQVLKYRGRAVCRAGLFHPGRSKLGRHNSFPAT